jgi:hypothetical protein
MGRALGSQALGSYDWPGQALSHKTHEARQPLDLHSPPSLPLTILPNRFYHRA